MEGRDRMCTCGSPLIHSLFAAFDQSVAMVEDDSP
jgi:hypothetical protein